MTIQPRERSGRRTVWAGVFGNSALICLKLWLGIVGRSQALVADAVHSMTDFVTDIMTFAGLRYANKEADSDHPFGHGKIETLMSLFIGLTMVLAGIWLGYEAGKSILTGEISAPTAVALLGALVSLVVKEALYHYTVRVGRRIKSQVLIANAWHHRSDAISSVAVLFGVAGALINPQWAFLDAIAALIVSLFIVKVGFDVIVPAFRTASDAAPDRATLEKLQAAAESVEEVREAHDIRARQYAEKLYVEVHIEVDPEITVSDGHAIANDVRDRMMENVEDILNVIVHVDPHEEG